jgi:hypothetical protein
MGAIISSMYVNLHVIYFSKIHTLNNVCLLIDRTNLKKKGMCEKSFSH